MAEPEGFAATFVSLYRQVHDELRNEVSDLDKSAMSWVPGPDTNSISTLVVHLLGSETEVLQIVRGLPPIGIAPQSSRPVSRIPKNS